MVDSNSFIGWMARFFSGAHGMVAALKRPRPLRAKETTGADHRGLCRWFPIKVLAALTQRAVNARSVSSRYGE